MIIIPEPFPHIVLADALSEEDYVGLFDAWKVAEDKPITHIHKVNRTPKVEFAWKESLAERLMEMFDVAGVPTIGRYIFRRAGYMLRPHADPAGGIITVIHYMPFEDAPEAPGTIILKALQPVSTEHDGGARWAIPGTYRYVKTVPFERNTMLAFLNTRSSLHAVNKLTHDRLAYQWHIK